MSETPHIKNIFSAEEEDCLSLEQMIAYRDGKLLAGEKHYAERHLLNCELCEMAYEGIVEEGEAGVEEGAAAIAAAAWERIEVQEKKRRRGAWIWISAAASIVLIITVSLVFFRGPSDETMQQVAEQYYQKPPPPPLAAEDSEDSAALALRKDAENTTSEEFANGEIREKEDAEFKSELKGLRNPQQIKETFTMAESQEGLEGAAYGDIDGGKSTFGNEPVGRNQKGGSGVVSKAPTAPKLSMPGKDAINPASPIAGNKVTTKNDVPRIADAEITDDFDVAFADEELEVEEESAVELDELVIADNRPKRELQQINSSSVTVESKKLNPISAAKESGKSKNRDRNLSRSNKSADVPAMAMDESTTLKDGMENMSGELEDATLEEKSNTSTGTIATGGVTNVADPYAQGMESYRKGRYTESATLLRKASAATPANLQAHYYAAASFMNIEQPQAAIYHLDRILAQPGNSLFADAQWYKALAYLKLKDRKNAKSLLEKIARDGGKHAGDATKALKDL